MNFEYLYLQRHPRKVSYLQQINDFFFSSDIKKETSKEKVVKNKIIVELGGKSGCMYEQSFM